MTELHEHLTAHHPGIGQATGPTGMYPQGRPVMHLEVAHEGQHRDYPEYQDHRHEPDGSLVMQTARAWPEPAVIETGSPEHLAGFTADQLRVLAASTRPEHIAYGLAAQLELIKRGEQASTTPLAAQPGERAVEIGMTRTTRVIGRDLVAAAILADERGQRTPVTKGGRVIAWIVPDGIAG